MKKILLVITLLIFNSCYISAQEFYDDEAEDIILEPQNVQILNINTPQKFESKKYDLKAPKQRNQKVLYYDERDTYSNKNYSITKEKNLNKRTTIGTKYNSSIGTDSLSNSVSLFSKYQRERFSINSAYKQNNLKTPGKTNLGTFSLTPEYKINEHFSVKNSLSENLSNNQKKNEVIFSIKPFNDNRLDLDLGAGQIYENNTGISRSQMNFSTKIKF